MRYHKGERKAKGTRREVTRKRKEEERDAWCGKGKK